jgi:hypothetical protein
MFRANVIAGIQSFDEDVKGPLFIFLYIIKQCLSFSTAGALDVPVSSIRYINKT